MISTLLNVIAYRLAGTPEARAAKAARETFGHPLLVHTGSWTGASAPGAREAPAVLLDFAIGQPAVGRLRHTEDGWIGSIASVTLEVGVMVPDGIPAEEIRPSLAAADRLEPQIVRVSALDKLEPFAGIVLGEVAAAIEGTGRWLISGCDIDLTFVDRHPALALSALVTVTRPSSTSSGIDYGAGE